jgi:hypothetical protein
MSDFDVLAPERLGPRLQRGLEQRGFRPAAGAYEQHLPILEHPEGGLVEVHGKILGVRLGSSRRSARLDDLRRAGLLEARVADGMELDVPVRPVLVAHAIAHGLGQHGYEPRAYSAFRMVADLVDLGFGPAEAHDPRLLGWLRASIPAAEVKGLAELCRRLVAGEDPRGATADPARAIFDHILAGAVDESYRQALKLRRLARPHSDAPRAVAIGMAMAKALFPSRAAFAAGRRDQGASSPLAWRRLSRPLAMASRAATALAGDWRVRRSRQR